MIVNYIRHGKTTGNELNRVCGIQIDYPLSPAGIEKINELKKKSIYPSHYDIAFTSTLTRAQSTFEQIYPEKDYRIRRCLDERNFGYIEQETDFKKLAEWRYHETTLPEDHPIRVNCGGETPAEFSERIIVSLKEIISEAQSDDAEEIVIVGHGAFLRFMAKIFDLNTAVISQSRTVDNARGLVFDGSLIDNQLNINLIGYIGYDKQGNML